MTKVHAWTVSSAEAGKRLDVAVADQLRDVSRSLARSLASEGMIRVDGRLGKPSTRLLPGQRVEAQIERKNTTFLAEEIPVSVVYRDSDLVVIDKPAGLVVHPAPGHWSGTLANAIVALFPKAAEVGDALRPGIVHRLDKDTSGLLVVALTPYAHALLQRQIAERSATREYKALATGTFDVPEGVIDTPIGRNPHDRKRMAVYGAASRQATTTYTVSEKLGAYSLLTVRLRTGRTHQIRVHLAAIGHPVVGDKTYGGPSMAGLHRQFLHAARLSITSPSTGRRLEFYSDLPDELSNVLQRLR